MAIDYQEKKKEIEAKFNQKLEEFKILQEQANILQQKVNENNAERTRLQGEFRLLDDLAKEEQKIKEVTPIIPKGNPKENPKKKKK